MMNLEAWKCPTCSLTHLRPWTTCFRCAPIVHEAEKRSFGDVAIEARPLAMDRYSMSMLVVTDLGVYVRVNDARYFIEDEWRGSRDKLISDLTKLRAEHTEVLAENARLRRRLEKK